MDYAVPKSLLSWLTLPGGGLMSRSADYLFVVRSDVDKPNAIRFAALKALPENGGLLHVICGYRRTTQEAVVAAERAAAVLSWGARHGLDICACRAVFCSTRVGGQKSESRAAFRPDAFQQPRRAA